MKVIDKIIDNSVKCVICNAKFGECDCWTKCNTKGCTWYIEKGQKCTGCKD